MEHTGNCTNRRAFIHMHRLIYTGYTVMYTTWLLDKCSLSPGEFHPGAVTPPHTVPCHHTANSGHKKQGFLSPQAPAINNLDRADEQAMLKNGIAQSLSISTLSFQVESKIRHLIGSNHSKHLHDQRIKSFSHRSLPDSSTSLEPRQHRSAAERLLLQYTTLNHAAHLEISSKAHWINLITAIKQNTLEDNYSLSLFPCRMNGSRSWRQMSGWTR